MSITWHTDDRLRHFTWERAVQGLAANLHWVQGQQVLLADDSDVGIGLACGPLHGLLLDDLAPGSGLAAARTFLARQRADGQFPSTVCAAKTDFDHVHEVVPLMAIAYELWQRTRDGDFLAAAYAAGVRWDAWLARQRGQQGAELSSAIYGMHLALARMAAALSPGRGQDPVAHVWRQRAERIREVLVQRRWSRDVANQHHGLHPLLEGLVDQPTFERIWAAQVVADDIQTALRTLVWLEHYGKYVAQATLLTRWSARLCARPTFRQWAELHLGHTRPSATGDSSAMLLFTESVARLYGVHRSAGGLAWNCRSTPEGTWHAYTLHAADVGDLCVQQRHDTTTLLRSGEVLATVRISGPSSETVACRVLTDGRGRVAGLLGTAPVTTAVTITCDGATQQLSVAPDAVITL